MDTGSRPACRVGYFGGLNEFLKNVIWEWVYGCFLMKRLWRLNKNLSIFDKNLS